MSSSRLERHGMSGTRIYDIWRDMRHRCSCKGMRNYRHYGGRGITVCEEWNNSFSKFHKWSISNGYTDDLTIDRIDVDGNYEPSNCRWVAGYIQAANRSNQGGCEYIGVFLHSNRSSYNSMIKKDSKIIFYYASRSKNDCARKRNQFIVENNLEYPLNDVMDCYEDIRNHKNDFIFSATNKNNGTVVESEKLKNLAAELKITPQFISQCIRGIRNSKEFLFEKRCHHG